MAVQEANHENPTKLEFYDVDASVLQDTARELLEQYSGLTEHDVYSHVEAIRQKAFAIWPYPCIGMFRFLDLSMSKTTVYDEVLSRIKQGENFLDLGCCFGQEIRKLVYDGAPAENTYGTDLRQEFIDLGFDLFKDKGRLNTTFIAADVFNDESPLQQLVGRMNVIYTGAFFHLFDLEEQEKVATRVVQLLEPKAGSLIIGRQMGNEQAGEFGTAGYGGEKKRFRHNADSWKKFWNRVGHKTQSQWQVEVQLQSRELGLQGPEDKLTEKRQEHGARRLEFVVRRI